MDQNYFTNTMCLESPELKPFSLELQLIKNVFNSWKPYQKTAAMCALMQELNFEHRQFLRSVLETFPKYVEKLEAVSKANNSDIVLNTIHRYANTRGREEHTKKPELMNELMQLLLLLKPGNFNAADMYLAFMPKVLVDSEKLILPTEMAQQFLSYMLLHPVFDTQQKSQIKTLATEFDDKVFTRKLKAVTEMKKVDEYSKESLQTYYEANESVKWLFQPLNLENRSLKNYTAEQNETYFNNTKEQLDKSLSVIMEEDDEVHQLAKALKANDKISKDSTENSKQKDELSQNSWPKTNRSYNLNVDAPVFTLSKRTNDIFAGATQHIPLQKSASDTCLKSREPYNPNSNPGMSRIAAWLEYIRQSNNMYVFRNMHYQSMLLLNENNLIESGVNKVAARKLSQHIKDLGSRSARLNRLSNVLLFGKIHFENTINELEKIMKTPMLPINLVERGEENIAQQFWEILRVVCEELCKKMPTLISGSYIRWKLLRLLDEAMECEQFEILIMEIQYYKIKLQDSTKKVNKKSRSKF